MTPPWKTVTVETCVDGIAIEAEVSLREDGEGVFLDAAEAESGNVVVLTWEHQDSMVMLAHEQVENDRGFWARED